MGLLIRSLLYPKILSYSEPFFSPLGVDAGSEGVGGYEVRGNAGRWCSGLILYNRSRDMDRFIYVSLFAGDMVSEASMFGVCLQHREYLATGHGFYRDMPSGAS